MMRDHLTPFARRVVDLHGAGHDVDAIARVFRRSPDHISRVIRWAEIPRQGLPERRFPSAFERCVLNLRAAGHSYTDIAGRFGATPRFIRRVEGMAHYRRALTLLREDSAVG